METPNKVFHGTFWSESVVPDKLELIGGYVATATTYEWAYYFALNRRYFEKNKPGLLAVYEIDTGLLDEEVVKSAIPPDGMDPRALTRDWFRVYEEEMRPERIKIGEWRFSCIPLSATTLRIERMLEADPRMRPWDVAIVQPRS